MPNLAKKTKAEMAQTRKTLSARNFQLTCETAPKLSLDKHLPLTEESLKLSWKNGFDAGFKAGFKAGQESCLAEQDRAA